MSSCVRAWFDPSERHRVGSRPDHRFSLADERTFLAWLRTGLALIGSAWPPRSWRTPCSALRCWPCGDDEIWVMISAMGRLFVLFALADLLLLAVALIDCLSCEDYEIRALPKVAWVLVILLFSPVGGIAWFVAGRPQRAGATRPRPGRADGVTTGQRRPLAPDDDPEFLRDLADRIRRDDAERLRRWEEDLRRREEELRRRQSTDDTDG